MNLMMISGDTSIVAGHDGAFYRMLQYFSAHWERIDVITPRPARVVRTQVFGNVYFHPANRSRILQPWHIVKTGKKLLGQREYGLISTHDYGFMYNGIGAWLLTRSSAVPYVSEIHHVEGYPHAVTWRERAYRALARIYLRRIWRAVAGIRVVNQREMRELLHSLGIPDDKILHIPSQYMEYDIFCPIPNTEKLYDVLFVGRLVANKGLYTIIEALAEVKHTQPGVKLAMLGRGPLKKALEETIAARELGDNVVWLGQVASGQDVARIYNQARMLVCASTAEGGPRVTIEAMACGVPVISTPVGVMRDILIDGENGLVFNWSAHELAECITRLLSNPELRQKLGQAGMEAVQGLEAEKMIAHYAAEYKRVAQTAKTKL